MALVQGRVLAPILLNIVFWFHNRSIPRWSKKWRSFDFVLEHKLHIRLRFWKPKA